MAISQNKSKRSSTGGRYISSRKKRSRELGNRPTLTKLGPYKAKTIRTKGGGEKQRTLVVDVCLVFNPKANKGEKAKILNIVETPANRHFTRRNIMTKGTVIETDKGKAKITGRPGQEGAVNAVLI
ncbi:MAG: 30S ribosomal protein S8e [archaeon]